MCLYTEMFVCVLEMVLQHCKELLTLITSLANSSFRYLLSKSPLSSDIPRVFPGEGLSKGGIVLVFCMKSGSGSG